MNATAILKLLEQGEELINRNACRDALTVIAQAKALAATPPEESQPETDEKSLEQRIEAVRVNLFDSFAFVDVASRAVDPDTDWPLRHALEVVGRQIDAACTTLEFIAGVREKGCVVSALHCMNDALDADDFAILLRALDVLDRDMQTELANKGQDAAAGETRSRILIVRTKLEKARKAVERKGGAA